MLYESGVRAIEVTLTSAGALDAFGRLVEELPGAVLGVGTVRSAADAEAAVAARATYLVADLSRDGGVRGRAGCRWCRGR